MMYPLKGSNKQLLSFNFYEMPCFSFFLKKGTRGILMECIGAAYLSYLCRVSVCIKIVMHVIGWRNKLHINETVNARK